MSEIILVAETGSDITKEIADKYGIELVPMHVSFENETLDDGEFDCFQESIYDLAHGKTTGIFDADTNEKVAEISSVEELYNWMMQPQEIFIPREENLN